MFLDKNWKLMIIYMNMQSKKKQALLDSNITILIFHSGHINLIF